MIILDASVLIAHTVAGDAHEALALDILDTEEELAVHPVTLAEFLVGPVRRDAAGAAMAFLDRLGVERTLPSADEPLALAQLRVSTRLPMPDCCVLVAAQHSGGTVATFDMRLADAARELGLTTVGTERRAARRTALEDARGTVDYPPGYLEELRNEWPE